MRIGKISEVTACNKKERHRKAGQVINKERNAVDGKMINTAYCLCMNANHKERGNELDQVNRSNSLQ